MKLSQDLYDAGILRRQRTGPSDDWAFDEPDVRLSQIVAGAWTRLRTRLFSARRRHAGQGVGVVRRQSEGWQQR